MGVKPIGVFLPAPGDGNGDEDISVFTVSAHADMEAFATISERLGQDAAFVDAAGEHLGTAKDDPAYTRISSKLMLSFAGAPDLQAPMTQRPCLEKPKHLTTTGFRAAMAADHDRQAISLVTSARSRLTGPRRARSLRA